jgi:hypothetical protein
VHAAEALLDGRRSTFVVRAFDTPPNSSLVPVLILVGSEETASFGGLIGTICEYPFYESGMLRAVFLCI